MSKLDAQRAMREARYAARQAAASGTSAPARRTPSAPAPTVQPQVAPGAPAGEGPPTAERPAAEASCGHRSMNGRTCIRPADHAEKNHRYG